MEKTLVKTRKFKKEEYKIYLHTPSYEGEVGVLGIKVDPYVTVETYKNDFGYEDIVYFDEAGHGCCFYRSLPNWIMKELEKINNKLLEELL